MDLNELQYEQGRKNFDFDKSMIASYKSIKETLTKNGCICDLSFKFSAIPNKMDGFILSDGFKEKEPDERCETMESALKKEDRDRLNVVFLLTPCEKQTGIFKDLKIYDEIKM